MNPNIIRAEELEKCADELENSLRNRDVPHSDSINWYRAQAKMYRETAVDLPDTEAQALQLLFMWLGKFALTNRWPCGECGRPNNDAPLRTIEARLEDGREQIIGCTWCLAESLVERTRAFLESD
jgi:hypothetical protein